MNALTRFVAERAEGRCEYWRLPSTYHPAPFQVDHVIARQHGGTAEPDNLAFACIHCNRHKGPNIAGIDPVTGNPASLFHPRKDRWDHFEWAGAILIGRTAFGRATIQTLAINAREMVELRRAIAEEG